MSTHHKTHHTVCKLFQVISQYKHHTTVTLQQRSMCAHKTHHTVCQLLQVTSQYKTSYNCNNPTTVHVFPPQDTPHYMQLLLVIKVRLTLPSHAPGLCSTGWTLPQTCAAPPLTPVAQQHNNNNNNNNNNERISRASFHVKHAQLRWTGANTKIQNTCI